MRDPFADPGGGLMAGDDLAATTDNLLSALQKLPRYDGLSFRGRGADATLGLARNSVVTAGLTATSRDVRIATENFSSSGLYVVVGSEGRSIESVSRHPEDREVVFLPSTLFLVVGRGTVANLDLTIVEQIDPNAEPAPNERRSVDEVVALASRAVLRGREASEVTIQSPGKFAGDID